MKTAKEGEMYEHNGADAQAGFRVDNVTIGKNKGLFNDGRIVTIHGYAAHSNKQRFQR